MRAMTNTLGLAARLKHDTRSLHTQAERSGVMADLLRGRLALADYCALLRNLQAIYAALEQGLDQHRADARLSRLWQPELRRLPALIQDLERLHEGDWRAELALMPASQAYAARLEQLAKEQPLLLLAHAYLRYLGDLYGGQMMARLVRQHYDLSGDEGTAFYAFGEAAEVERLKQQFRAGLDALNLNAEQADAVVAEACEAFQRHQQLFEELQPAA